MTYLRTAAVFLAAFAALLGVCSPASAAVFGLQPGPYSNSGAGPFQWSFSTSSDPNGPTGRVAYKLSTEPSWHRCGHDYPPRLSNLSDGVYTATIADDINLDWYAANGTAFSSMTQPCFDASPGAPNTPLTTSTLVVDSTPPIVGVPRVVSSDLDTLLSVDASDVTSGIQTVTWATGDGQVSQGSTFLRHQYLGYGSWPASVTVSDNAGNSTTRSFPVVLTKPAAVVPIETLPRPTSAIPTMTADTTPPHLSSRLGAIRTVARSRALRVRLACSEICTTSTSGTLVISHRRYPIGAVRRRVATQTATTVTLRLSKATARALRAAAKHRRRATITVRVAAVDAAGNVSKLRTLRAVLVR
jgi:hypothetical protein